MSSECSGPAQKRWFDAHLHIIDPRFPLIANQGYLPPEFTAQHYGDAMAQGLPDDVTLAGGAVVSGSFQGYDQSYLINALKELGPGFVGVAQVPAETGLEELTRLHQAGVRALRFNLYRGTAADLATLERTAALIYEHFHWHIELYVDASDLGELEALIPNLPKVSIDHLGLRSDGLETLQGLVEQGCYVKATGFGRLDFDPVAAMTALYRCNPAALVFGSDLPSTRAPQPFQFSDLQRLRDAVGVEGFERVLWNNACDLYGIEQ